MLKEQKSRDLFKFLRLIPNFIWPLIAVVIGGLLAWVPLRWQLEHDSREREKERQMSVRRNVYLSAAEKIGQQLTYLADFPKRRREPLPEGYRDLITQIQVIGSKETLVAVNRFDDYMNEAFNELAPQILEIVLLEKKFDSLDKVEDKTREERGIYLEQMKEHNLLGIIDERKWSVIETNSDSAKSRSDQLMKELKKTGDKIVKLTCDLTPKCQQKAQSAEELLISVIVAIRKELDAPFDEKAYRAMMEASHNKSKDNLEKLIASMKDKYERAMQAIEQENIYDEE